MIDKIIYNKLVRDKIPEIIEKSGKFPEIEILDSESYNSALTKKMQEELDEYKENCDIEELADLQEVINSILDFKKISKEDFYNIVNEKQEKRGSFKKRIFLKSVINK